MSGNCVRGVGHASKAFLNFRNKNSFNGICLIIFYTSIFATLTTISSVEGGSNSKNHKAVNIPSKDAQRISILIEGDSPTDGDKVVGIQADGDEDGGGSNSTRTDVESATWQQCRGPSSRCCYQYTWTGLTHSIPIDPNNATCDYLRKERKDDESFACFDPIVYTTSRNGSNAVEGTPPNFTELVTRAKRDNWNIYCPMATGKSCVTLTYYARSGDKDMQNQTRFCGEVINTNSGGMIENGCHKQNVAGSVREVCVCSNNLCNSKGIIFFPSPTSFITSLTFVLIYVFS